MANQKLRVLCAFFGSSVTKKKVNVNVRGLQIPLYWHHGIANLAEPCCSKNGKSNDDPSINQLSS